MLLHYPAKLKMQLYHFLLQLLQKLTSKFTYFVNLNSYYMARIKVTCFWLNSNCLSYARHVASSLSSSKTMLAQWARTASISVSSILVFWNGRHHVHFIWLWLQHPTEPSELQDLCSAKMQQRVYLKKFITRSSRHYGMVLSYASSIMQQMNGVNVYECDSCETWSVQFCLRTFFVPAPVCTDVCSCSGELGDMDPTHPHWL